MIINTLLRFTEKVSPKLVAKMAYNYMSNPPLKKMRSFEKEIIEKARKSSMKFKQADVQIYEWGEGNQTALLVHGWGGRASNYGAIVPVLCQNGYKVISFDAPGHGNTKSKNNVLFDFEDLIRVFLEKQKYDLILTHSMGSVMALMAMSSINYTGKKLFILTTPDRFEDSVHYHVITTFGLTDKTKTALLNLFRSKIKYEPLELRAIDFTGNINFDKVTFIHDINDKTISMDQAKNVHDHMKNSEFLEIEGTGHFKMLWDKKTTDLIEERIK